MMADNKRYENKPVLDSVKAVQKKYKMDRKDLVEDENVTRGREARNNRLQLDKLRAIIEKTVDRVNDATGIMELLPDLYLLRDIIVASTLSPKDLTEIKLTITADDNVPGEITEIVRKHFTGEYDLESKLSSILADALFNVGSHVLLPIPAMALHAVMNSNSTVLESFNGSHLKDFKLPNVGVLGHKPNMVKSDVDPIYGMESFGTKYHGSETSDVKSLIEITDNAIYLLAPSLLKITQRVNVKKRTMNAYGLEGLEYNSGKDKNPYMRKMYNMVESVMLKRVDLDKVGLNLDPIVLTLPPESVIPVFVPGEPENHVGYYVILDEMGTPLQASKNSNFFKELNDKLESTVTSGGNQIIKSSLNITEIEGQTLASNFRQPIMDAYISQLEDELRAGVENGVLGETVEISRPDHLYRLMFARQLKKMQTKALYIPAEMLTYVAFDYDELGIGLSLIEKTKLYSSLRAILMFADVMAGIKNSVPGRILSIVLDEHDPDPQATIESVLNEFTALQTSGLPLGKLNPSEIVDALQRAGIQVKIEGGDVFPNTSIDIEENKRDMTKPDTDLSDMLKKMQYAGFGVSPELADRGLEGEFATGITQSNLLQTKRVMVWQDMYTMHLTDHVHKYIYAGGPLFKEIKEIWEKIDSEDKLTLEELISSLRVELPKPDTAVIKAQSESFKDYSEFIELAVTTHINEDMLKGMLQGDYSESALFGLQRAITDLAKRQYMRKQNILPELDELLTGADTNTSELISQHNEAIIKMVGEVLPKLFKKEYMLVDKKTAAVIAEVDEMKEADNPDGNEDDSSSDGGDGGDSGGDGGMDESGGGADEFGGDTGGGEDNMDMGDLGMDTGDETATDTTETDTAVEDTTTTETPAEAAPDEGEVTAEEPVEATAEEPAAAAEPAATETETPPAEEVEAKPADEETPPAEEETDTEKKDEFGNPIEYDGEGKAIKKDKDGKVIEAEKEAVDKEKEKEAADKAKEKEAADKEKDKKDDDKK